MIWFKRLYILLKMNSDNKMINILCQTRISRECLKVHSLDELSIKNIERKYDGKYICNICQKLIEEVKSIDYLSSSKYEFNIEKIDTEGKAYLLGILYNSSYKVGDKISIRLGMKNLQLMNNLHMLLGKKYSIKNENGNLSLKIEDKYTNILIHKHMGDRLSGFPYIKDDKLKNDFIRGILDSSYEPLITDSNDVICKLHISNEIYYYFEEINNIPCDIKECDGFKILYFKNYNCLDLLSKLYDNCNSRYRNDYIYKKYLYLLKNSNISIPKVLFKKDCDEAIVPSKSRASDAGYDLTVIKKVKDISSKTAMYDTGIKIQPPLGYYTKIFPRSSLSKSGYMLSNSVGIIDPTYNGNLLIVLTRIDDTLPELKFPFKCAQLVLEKFNHYILEEKVDNILKTNRGSGGFGSTGF